MNARRTAAVVWVLVVLFAGALTAGRARADDLSAPEAGPSSSTSAGPGVRISVGEPATLTVWNRPIATLRAQIDQMTPQMRIERVRRRIANLSPEAQTGEIRAVAGTFGAVSGYWIQAEGTTLLALMPEDLDPDAGEPLDRVARAAAENLQAALRARQEQQQLPALLHSTLMAAISTAVFALAVWALAWLRNRALLRSQQRVHDHPLHIRGLNLRPYLRAIEEGAIKFTAVGAGLAVTYLWLTLVLGAFSYTRPWGKGLADWLGDTLATLASGAAGALPGLFTVVIIFLATRLIVQAVDRFFSSVERGWLKVHWLEAETARATRRIAVVLIWLFALTVAYPYIPGSHSDAFKGISVFVGLIISLGSAGFVNQVMSGLVIVYSRSLRSGEFVQVGDTMGKVGEIGVLATRIVTFTRQEITIPNAALVGSPITNYSRLADAQTGSIISTTVTIGYDAPWRQVHAMLLLAAGRTGGVRQEPKPRILQRSLSDFYAEYRLLISIEPPENQPYVLSELHGHIQDVFNEFGVQIMSPHFRDQPAEKVWVAQADWYAAPAATSDEGVSSLETPVAPAADADCVSSRPSS